MAISITFAATPVLAPAVISQPGGTTINVTQGQEFVLSFRLEWDRPENGRFGIVLKWFSPENNPAENFTIVGVSAYFDNDQTINAAVTSEFEGPWDSGTLYTRAVGTPVSDPNNGPFNVDITIQAGSEGVAHAPGTDNIEIEGSILVAEGDPQYWVEYYPPDPVITINVTEWTKGYVVSGKDSAYSEDFTDDGDPPAMDPYSMGENPPVVAAQKIGSGAVIALGMHYNLLNDRWNDVVNPAPHMDDLVDIAIQWGAAGTDNDNILWHTGWETAVMRTPPPIIAYMSCENFQDALIGMGYSITEDNDNLQDILSGYDILIISGYQLGDEFSGGDPSLLPDHEVTAINSFVQAGGILVIFNNYDTSGHNYYKTHNKILAGVGFDWCFQSDSIWDDVNNYGDYKKQSILAVDTTTVIGATYQARTGTDNLGSYVPNSLVEWPELSVTVSISPAENSAGAGDKVNFVAKITNTGTANDKYYLTLTDDSGWPELSFLPTILLAELDPDVPDGTGVSVYENTPDTVFVGDDYYGDPYRIYMGSDAGGRYRMFVKFDLSGIPGEVMSAGLEYRVYAIVEENQWLGIHAVDNDNWPGVDNYLLTWDNQPDIGATINTRFIDTDDKYEYITTDVTSFVQAEHVGDGTAAFALISENENNILGRIQFLAQKFVLIVTYKTLVTSTSVYVDATTSSETVGLTVQIDNDAGYCTRDTLTVTATSAHDSSVDNSGTAKAHSLGVPSINREVEVIIEDNYKEAVLIIDRDAYRKRYDPITFKVIVRNTGKLPDKYLLTATDGEGWMLELTPTELYIEPGKFDIAALSVTVPEDAEGCFEKNITVDAEGTLAASTVDDPNNVGDSDTCIVHVEIARCVRIDILPWQTQTGTPGSFIKWVIRLKNLGNVTNNYDFGIDWEIKDYNRTYENVGRVEIVPENLELPLCEVGQAQLHLWIPENLETSTMIRITVTATSRDDNENCVDNATVWVHVVRSIPKIPQGVIKLTVETEIIAIQVWPTTGDFGILDEAEESNSIGPFTVRNIGNKNVAVTITGSDAKSQPGEPIATWELSDVGFIGLDRYAMQYENASGWNVLNTLGSPLVAGALVPSEECNFNLEMTAPGAITVPSRMWTIVTLTAVKS